MLLVSYDDITAAFMTEAAAAIPAPVLRDSAARRLRDALEPIATQGWWSRDAAERVQALGVDFFTGYVWGRAAALGVPTPAVVAATFGVFQPDVIGAVFAAGTAAASRDDVLAAREAGASASIAAVTTPDEAAAIADPLIAALDGADGLGRPLFSALRALPMPHTSAGRLWRAAELVREHRGDSHLAAIVASGLDAEVANVLTELWLGFAPGEYAQTRAMSGDAVEAALATLTASGWVAEGVLTSQGRAARDDIEAATDRAQGSLVAALGADLDKIVAGAAAISERLLAARAFPTDPRKRAAG